MALTTCSAGEGKPFRIGDAAHQAAAGEGGPRYEADQTPEERSSEENGLWLCSSCHRKIDGDKYRYSVENLREMKIEAEERARRMVHGDIAFEMRDKEAAAIEHYLSTRPLTNLLPSSSQNANDEMVIDGARLGIQVIPYTAIINRPSLSYPELLERGVPINQFGINRRAADQLMK
jgi:hypothetical protein